MTPSTPRFYREFNCRGYISLVSPTKRPQDNIPSSPGPLDRGQPIRGATKKERSANRRKNGNKQKELTKAANRLALKNAAIAEAAAREEEKRLAIARANAARKLKRQLEESQRRREDNRRARAIRKRSKKIQDIFTESYSLAAFLRYIFPITSPKPTTKTKVFASPSKKPSPAAVEDFVGNDWRWRHFFADRQMVPDLLTFLASKAPPSVRSQFTEFAICHVEGILRSEARKITQSKVLWARGKRIDEDFLQAFNLQTLHEKFSKELAPTSIRIMTHIATSKDQQKKMSGQMRRRKETVTTFAYSSLLAEYSRTNAGLRQVMGLYLYAAGAQRQTISILHGVGTSCGYTTITNTPPDALNIVPEAHIASTVAVAEGMEGGEGDEVAVDNSTPASSCETATRLDPASDNSRSSATPSSGSARRVIVRTEDEEREWEERVTGGSTPTKPPSRRTPGLIYRLSESCREKTRLVAKDDLTLELYDNINMAEEVGEQVIGKKKTIQSGTCTTVIELFKTLREHLRMSTYAQSFQEAGELTFEDIDFSPAERKEWDNYILFTIIDIITTHGGPLLTQYREDFERERPASNTTIPPHKTQVHPLPTFHIDESSRVGNAEVVDAILKELEISKDDPEFLKHVRLFAGDQLSISRLRSIMEYRVGHEGGSAAYAWLILIMGLFHMKMAANHGILETFLGKERKNPGSLASHNSLLYRPPISLKSPPPFRKTEQLIFYSLYARILHLCLQVSNSKDLQDFGKKVTSFSRLKVYAQQIADTYLDTQLIRDIRDGGADERDHVYESAVLFLRDALVLRQFTDAVKHGDSGRVVMALRVFTLACRGNGRTKYAHELLFLMHNLSHVWPEKLKEAVLNNWLVNTTGKKDGFLELDLLQEHLNLLIKVIYAAHGSNASWDWLKIVSPCILLLRKLSDDIHQTLGCKQGKRHCPPDISRDLGILMTNLAKEEVYTRKYGRRFEPDDVPPADVIDKGAEALLDGGLNSPLAKFNREFKTLRERLNIPPLVGGPPMPGDDDEAASDERVDRGSARDAVAGEMDGSRGTDPADGRGGVNEGVVDAGNTSGGESGSEVGDEVLEGRSESSDGGESEAEDLLGGDQSKEAEDEDEDDELGLARAEDVALEEEYEERWDDEDNESDEDFDAD